MSRARDLADSADKDIVGTLTIDKLGINDTAPSSLLQITQTADNATGGLQIRNTADSNSIYIYQDGNVTTYDAGSSGEQAFKTANAEAMRIDSSGNVGIGTTSPSSELQVIGSSDVDTGILVTNSRNGVGMALRLDNTNNGAGRGSGIKWQSGGFNTGAVITRSVGTAASGDAPGYMTFHTSNDGAEDLAERMRLDASGSLMLGKTTLGVANVGAELRDGVSDYAVTGVSSSQAAALFGRNTDDGDIIRLRKNNSNIGSISYYSYGFQIQGESGHSGISFAGNSWIPLDNGTRTDDLISLGLSTYRFDDAYITDGVTTGSDENDKHGITELTATEMLVASRLSQTFRTYKWNKAVALKGDNARTHTGTVAQEVQDAFTAEGLDAGDYAMFMSDTWWTHDVDVPAVEAVAEVTDEYGNVTTEAVEAKDAYTRTDIYETEDEAPEGATEKTRLGIRYTELLSFVAAYNEQRFASIEARLTALEA